MLSSSSYFCVFPDNDPRLGIRERELEPWLEELGFWQMDCAADEIAIWEQQAVVEGSALAAEGLGREERVPQVEEMLVLASQREVEEAEEAEEA